LTLLLHVKASSGDWYIHKKLNEIRILRTDLQEYWENKASSSGTTIPYTLPKLSIKREWERSEDGLMQLMTVCEVFLQDVVSTSSLHCDLFYAFLDLPKTKKKKNAPHLSGATPIANYILPAYASVLENPSDSLTTPSATRERTITINASPASSNRPGQTPTSTKRLEFTTSALFPEVDPAVAQKKPVSSRRAVTSFIGESSSETTTSDDHDTPMVSSSARSSLSIDNRKSPNKANSGNKELLHRFAVYIPNYAWAESSTGKPYVKYTIVVREFFAVTSFLEWRVVRRYKDFENLHYALKAKNIFLAGTEYPELPPKSHKIGAPTAHFLDDRLAALEIYLQRIINLNNVQIEEFFSFFDLNNANRQFSVGTTAEVSNS
jgi:hypothetical protein